MLSVLVFSLFLIVKDGTRHYSEFYAGIQCWKCHLTTVLPKCFWSVRNCLATNWSDQYYHLTSVKFTKLFISNTSSRSKILAQFSLECPHLRQPKIHIHRSCPRVTLCMEVILVICVPTSAITSPCEQACGSIEPLRFFSTTQDGSYVNPDLFTPQMHKCSLGSLNV